MAELQEEEDALYQVAPPQFVAARDALVRRLRSKGHRGDASRIAKLRRPTPAAWALNRVARDQSGLVEDVLAAGNELRRATEAAVGGDASGLRAARAKERSSVDAVIRAAVASLEEIGSTANEVTRQRLADTLRAAIVDPAVAESWRQATLATDHDAPGFGMDAFSAPEGAPVAGRAPSSPTGAPVAGRAPSSPTGAPEPPPPESAPRPGGGAPEPRADEERLEAEAERQVAAWRRLVVEASRATAEAERLAAESARLAADAERLAAEAARAARSATEAENRAAAARDRAADAEARAAEAEQESDQARARAAAARAASP